MDSSPTNGCANDGADDTAHLPVVSPGPVALSGKSWVGDGRTGECFDTRPWGIVTVEVDWSGKRKQGRWFFVRYTGETVERMVRRGALASLS